MRTDKLKCRAKCTQTNEWAYGIAGYTDDGDVILRNNPELLKVDEQ